MAEALSPYPWQAAQWKRLQHQRQQGVLPHAILLFGQTGLGLDHFARCLVQSLICERSGENGYACGECPFCRQFAGAVYPDSQFIHLQEGKNQIRVDQIRALTGFLSLTRSGSAVKTVTISPADRMNPNAANSLLKTLEEPPGSALILLVAHHLNRLPATIRSRCQIVRFTRPDRELAHAWLASRGHEAPDKLLRLAQGAPCLAESLDDPALFSQYQAVMEGALGLLSGGKTGLQLRKSWSTCGIENLVFWSQSLVRDAIRLVSGIQASGFENSLYFSQLRQHERLLDLPGLFRIQDHLVHLGDLLDHPLNADLLVDDVILAWQSSGARGATGSDSKTC